MSVVKLLLNGPTTPAKIARETGFRIYHVSRALAELASARLVECKTPFQKKNRFYALTKLGLKVSKLQRI